MTKTQATASKPPSGPIGQLPETGYVRQSQLIGTRASKATATKAGKPAVPGIIPISSATFWRKVKSGDFPSPVKLSERVTAWRVEDVRKWMQARAA